jgi:hypothetical protein
MSAYLSIAIQAVAVIIGGIIIWRASVSIQKKKQAQRIRNTYFESAYSKGWKRKN